MLTEACRYHALACQVIIAEVQSLRSHQPAQLRGDRACAQHENQAKMGL